VPKRLTQQLKLAYQPFFEPVNYFLQQSQILTTKPEQYLKTRSQKKERPTPNAPYFTIQFTIALTVTSAVTSAVTLLY